jgi:hypothetical protein
MLKEGTKTPIRLHTLQCSRRIDHCRVIWHFPKKHDFPPVACRGVDRKISPDGQRVHFMQKQGPHLIRHHGKAGRQVCMRHGGDERGPPLDC